MGSLQNLMNGNAAGNNQQPQQFQYQQGKGGGGQWYSHYRGGRGFGHTQRQQPQGPGLHEKVDKLSEALAEIAKAQPQLIAQQPASMPATGQPVVAPMPPPTNGQPLLFSPLPSETIAEIMSADVERCSTSCESKSFAGSTARLSEPKLFGSNFEHMMQALHVSGRLALFVIHRSL